MTRLNEFGQPIGDPVENWTEKEGAERVTLIGRYAELEPLRREHAPAILTSLGSHPDLWTYRKDEPPQTLDEAHALVDRARAGDDIPFVVIRRDTSGRRGMLTLMRTDRANGVIEVGNIIYAPDLQRTRVATEALSLIAAYVFEDLGYRRFEWKCDSLNEPSRRAALRLGFTEEGTFRNHVVYKGRSRDTTWFSMTAEDWPRIDTAHRLWLDQSNFDANGQQRRKLSEVFASLET